MKFFLCIYKYRNILNIDEHLRVRIRETMELRAELELPKLNINDTVWVRILAVEVKHI